MGVYIGGCVRVRLWAYALVGVCMNGCVYVCMCRCVDEWVCMCPWVDRWVGV